MNRASLDCESLDRESWNRTTPSIQRIVKGKDDCARIPVSSTKMNKYIADYRRQRAQQFYLFQKTARSEVSDENCKINDASPEEIKHTWPAGTCIIWETLLWLDRWKKGLVRIDKWKCMILGVLLHRISTIIFRS